MTLPPPFGPPTLSLTARDVAYCFFAFFAALMAGYGVPRIGWAFGADTWIELIALVVGICALGLTLRGVSALQADREKAEAEQRALDQRIK
jgi:hypothetical protein